MSMTSFYPGPLDIHRPINTHWFYFSSFLPLLTEGFVFNSEICKLSLAQKCWFWQYIWDGCRKFQKKFQHNFLWCMAMYKVKASLYVVSKRTPLCQNRKNLNWKVGRRKWDRPIWPQTFLHIDEVPCALCLFFFFFVDSICNSQ